MNEYYHVSLKRNELSILENGLMPTIGELSSLSGESTKAIYLFRSLEDLDNALMNWLGQAIDDNYGEDEPIVVFKINLPSNWVDHEAFETRYYDIISPEYIEVLRYE